MPKKKTESPDSMARIQDAIDALQDRVSIIEQTMGERQTSTSDGSLPPLPCRIGKKYEGSRKDIRARIDANLYSLLFNMAGEQFGGNVSRCLDVILWEYFDRPSLSFQNPDQQELG